MDNQKTNASRKGTEILEMDQSKQIEETIQNKCKYLTFEGVEEKNTKESII